MNRYTPGYCVLTVSLLFSLAPSRAISQETSPLRNASLTVNVVNEARTAALSTPLPDLSAFSVAKVRNGVPSNLTGSVSVGTTDGERFLDETFHKARRKAFELKQGTTDLQVIKVQSGAVTLNQLVEQIGDESIASSELGIVTLKLPVLIQPGSALIVDGKQTPEVRLSTDRGAFLANAGSLYVLDAKVSSWDEAEARSTAYLKKTSFRPFIASYIRSRTYLVGSSFHDLGYAAPTSYGLSLSSEPERDNEAPMSDWPTGIIIGNDFRGLLYGFYSYEARDVVLLNNSYVDNVMYGIDPHDRSTRLIISNNTVTGTRERHGIIGSRGISGSFIVDNITHHNNGSGIMLDRHCRQNVIRGNLCYENGQGIAIYESKENVIENNLIALNKKSGIRIRNSSLITVVGNTIVGNLDYGVDLYSKRLDDHDKRMAKGDLYEQVVEASLYDNWISGNRGLAKARQLHALRLGGVRQDLDVADIRSKLGVAVLQLDTENDRKFGGDLALISEPLQRVFEGEQPILEVVPDLGASIDTTTNLNDPVRSKY
jgi:poly(beta-D-mannuronate) C5 epimerase